jgi:uncharacterized membrane protein YphA (DoxX/SURF4 family)
MKERFALVFLVLLRMAIGWHFLFEGVEKQRSVNIGPTETNRPWTSEGYFREAQGPLAVLILKKIGDLDQLALARLTVNDSAPIPAPLAQEWNDYAQRFANHYKLSSEQRKVMDDKLQQQRERTAFWIRARLYSPDWALSGLWSDLDRKPFKHATAVPPFESTESVAERVEEYRTKLAEYHSLLHEKPEAMGKDVEKIRRSILRSDLVALRSELLAMLDGRTAEMKSSLAEILTPEQLSLGSVPEPASRRSFIYYVDLLTRWSLLLIGIGLLLGLFSRTSAFAGALFLLMTVLSTPALPWLPEPPNTEGHYVIISKNVIEMLALFMLACIPSGRWFGLDALVDALVPRRKKVY